MRRVLGERRVGHTGTLDPFAAGVLPVFIGHATRLVEYHMTDDKEYRALVCFGAKRHQCSNQESEGSRRHGHDRVSAFGSRRWRSH